MERAITAVLATLACGVGLHTSCAAAHSQPDLALRLAVSRPVVGHVGPLLERASWGEPGPEAARAPGTRADRPWGVLREELAQSGARGAKGDIT